MAWKRGIGTFHEPRRDAPRRCERRRGNGGTPKTTDRLPSVEFIHSLGIRSQFWSAARQMANSPRRQCPQAPSKEPRSVICRVMMEPAFKSRDEAEMSARACKFTGGLLVKLSMARRYAEP
mmetsp:Transcript_2568/g.5687  ORF Transcript_2568/g.5687 Transcript_2568/m.5687 type:complete len:121 (+) Transcript_2568:134-496(+)